MATLNGRSTSAASTPPCSTGGRHCPRKRVWGSDSSPFRCCKFDATGRAAVTWRAAIRGRVSRFLDRSDAHIDERLYAYKYVWSLSSRPSRRTGAHRERDPKGVDDCKRL